MLHLWVNTCDGLRDTPSMQLSPGRRIGHPAWARGLQGHEFNRNKSFAMATFWGVRRKPAYWLLPWSRSSKAARPPNRLRPRASRVTGVRPARHPMHKMDRSPRRIIRRRIRTRVPTRDRPNIPARRHLPRRPHQESATDSLRGLPISLAKTNPMGTTGTRLRRPQRRRLRLPARSP